MLLCNNLLYLSSVAGCGVKMMSLANLKSSQYIPIHSKQIRGLAFGTRADGLLLSAALDSTLKLTRWALLPVPAGFGCVQEVGFYSDFWFLFCFLKDAAKVRSGLHSLPACGNYQREGLIDAFASLRWRCHGAPSLWQFSQGKQVIQDRLANCVENKCNIIYRRDISCPLGFLLLQGNVKCGNLYSIKQK